MQFPDQDCQARDQLFFKATVCIHESGDFSAVFTAKDK
jgi:hypothetical protein